MKFLESPRINAKKNLCHIGLHSKIESVGFIDNFYLHFTKCKHCNKKLNKYVSYRKKPYDPENFGIVNHKKLRGKDWEEHIYMTNFDTKNH